MRLTLIFVAVLAASVIATSLAAWGITYGVSSDRVTTMASEFTQLGLDLLHLFDTSVSRLLLRNSDLVSNILALERQSGDTRMRQTKAQVLQIIGALVNYTINATSQSQQQMNGVVDTFAALMGSVFIDFKGVTMTYASQLRSELAAKVATYITTTVYSYSSILHRFQTLYSLGLVNISLAYGDPITPDDCLVLGLVCESAVDFGFYGGSAYLTTAGGRLYFCDPARGYMFLTQLVVNGTQATEYRQTWVPGMSNFKQQCLTQKPVSVVVNQGCLQPQSCQCGVDARCMPWYKPYRSFFGQNTAISEVYTNVLNKLVFAVTFSFTNTSATPPSLMAVAGVDFEFDIAQMVLRGVPMPPKTLLGLFVNGSTLIQFAAVARLCTANETQPGDPSLPSWSALRSCDPNLREVATWLWENRAAVTTPTSVRLSGFVWDILPSNALALAFFIVVGAKDEDTYSIINDSASKAAMQLSSVRAQQLGLVAANGAATQAYMAAVQASNIQEVQAMQASFVAEMNNLENATRTELIASQQSSTAEVAQLMDSQTRQVAALKTKHLNAMAAATGWILGVVFSILVIVLLSSAWGTVRVTTSLNNIIGLMEDVADMKVENLEVPKASQVTEVARIQNAFQVLVVRLAEYKSYMPASLFQQEEDVVEAEEASAPAQQNTVDVALSECSDNESRHRGSRRGRQSSLLSAMQSGMGRKSHGVVVVVPSATKHHGMRNMTVLVVNVTRFMETLPTMNDEAVKAGFSPCVTTVHEVVTKERGNVDCVLGDRVVVTFNAHIPCSDPAGAAATAALSIQRELRLQAFHQLNFQIGVSFGKAYAGVVGYTKFKSMVTMGYPVKLATMLSHSPDFDNGAILADTMAEERLRYNFHLRAVEVVQYPQLGVCSKVPSSGTIFLVEKKEVLKEDEWMYQLRRSSECDWATALCQLQKAQTLQEMERLLAEYLAAHPQDPIALRLKHRLPAWLPGAGVPL